MSKDKNNRPSIRGLFDNARHIRYTVVSPWDRLPMDIAGKLIILTDQFQALNTAWNLTRLSNDCQYKASIDQQREIVVTVLEKGKNVFPDQYEADLLSRTYLHEGTVKVPDSELWIFTRLYWMLVYERFLADSYQDRKMLMEFVFRRTGIPIRTRYRWLPFDAGPTPKPVS